MAALKSETRIKQIDTTLPANSGNEYSQGDVVYDQSKGIMKKGASTFGGVAITIEKSMEAFQEKTGATGTVEHDCSTANIFYHTSPAANWTINFTNLGVSTSYASSFCIVIVQGATARIPTAIQIDGSAQTLKWQGGAQPLGTNNGVDVVTFSIFNSSGTYTILGQLVDFA